MSIDSERPLSNAYIVDEDLKLKDAGLIAVSAAAQVDASNQILDLGLGRVKGDVMIDVTALEIASNDELYTLIAQFSNDSGFATGVVSGSMIQLGATEVAFGNADDGVVGRYQLPVMNIIADVHYRYMRLYTEISGTIATGIDYVANLTFDTRGF